MLPLPTSLSTETDTTAGKAGTKPLSGIIWLILAEACLPVLVAKEKLQNLAGAEHEERFPLLIQRGKRREAPFPSLRSEE
jgi:hypothetical protein